jgi:hypothetical protein
MTAMLVKSIGIQSPGQISVQVQKRSAAAAAVRRHELAQIAAF